MYCVCSTASTAGTAGTAVQHSTAKLMYRRSSGEIRYLLTDGFRGKKISLGFAKASFYFGVWLTPFPHRRFGGMAENGKSLPFARGALPSTIPVFQVDTKSDRFDNYPLEAHEIVKTREICILCGP